MSNKIFPGEKAIRVGKYKIWLCEKEGCREPIPPRGRKFCINHQRKYSILLPSPREKTLLTKSLHGNDFYYAFDEAFGLLYLELKELSGAML